MGREKSSATKTKEAPESKQPQVEKFGGWAMSSWDLMHGLDVVEDVSLDDWENETSLTQPRLG